ncbi:MAG: hypothetical protein IT233_07295 [Bacteroidia bacterium]|nr:hypothetical protein [Bacteroidia bacterium]
MRSAVLLGLLILGGSLYCQDSTRIKKTEKPRSPRTACILSGVLPGAGQVYNRKYWKVPVIYAGMAIPAWFAADMHREYDLFRDAYLLRTDGDSATTDNFPLFTDDQLRENVDFYRRYRDMNIFLTALVYVLNIVDAGVDAHLSTFNVSNDLSVNWTIRPGPDSRPQYGLRFTF